MRATRCFVAFAVLLSAGCTSTPSRHDMLLLNEALRQGDVTDETVDAVLASISSLADNPPDGDEGLYAATSLARIAIESPMGLMRAEALRAAWICLEPRTMRPMEVNEIERGEFVERTRRFEELMLTVETPTEAQRAEFTELGLWLSELRVGLDKVWLAVDLADVITSRTVDEFTDGIELDEEGTVLHAVTLATLYLAGDPMPVVRQEVGASLRHMHPSIGIELFASMAVRETDSLAVIRALDAISPRADEFPRDVLDGILGDLESDPSPSVARRAKELRSAP